MMEQIVQIFQTISNLVYYFLILSYNIGYVLFSILIYLINIFGLVLNKIGRFLVVFYEDFRIFQHDLTSFISCIGVSTLKTSETGITSTWEFLRAVFETFVEAFTTGHVRLSRFGTTSSEILVLIAEKIKRLAILMGNSVWLILTLLPNLFVYIVQLLYKAIILFGLFCWNLILSGCQLMFTITIRILDYFKDIPIQSAIGLICVYYCIKYYRFIAPLVNFLKQRTIRKLRHVQAQAATYMRRQYTILFFELRNSLGLGLRFFRRQNRHPRVNRPLQIQQRPQIGTVKNNNRLDNCDSILKESLLCIICQDRDKCVLLFPCKHLCLCSECAAIIDAYENKCPICRVSIYQKIKVFV